jgi:hypothetical protein
MAGAIAVWSAGCTLFRSDQAPSPPPAVRAVPQKSAVTRLPPARHSVPLVVSKPAPLRLNLPPPRSNPLPLPAPLVTLDSSAEAKAQAQRLLDQAAARLAHVDQAQLAGNAAFTYQQANGMIEAAQRAMAVQDYPAASSLAEKASALTDQLPAPK